MTGPVTLGTGTFHPLPSMVDSRGLGEESQSVASNYKIFSIL